MPTICLATGSKLLQMLKTVTHTMPRYLRSLWSFQDSLYENAYFNIFALLAEHMAFATFRAISDVAMQCPPHASPPSAPDSLDMLFLLPHAESFCIDDDITAADDILMPFRTRHTASACFGVLRFATFLYARCRLRDDTDDEKLLLNYRTYGQFRENASPQAIISMLSLPFDYRLACSSVTKMHMIQTPALGFHFEVELASLRFHGLMIDALWCVSIFSRAAAPTIISTRGHADALY